MFVVACVVIDPLQIFELYYGSVQTLEMQTVCMRDQNDELSKSNCT